VSSIFQKHGIQGPVLMLAPLEGITNHAFRSGICELGGVDTVATEFVRITGPKQKVRAFNRDPKVPLQIQLMGTDPAVLSGVISFLKKKQVLFEDDWLDLNVGCPSRRVNSSGAGASLLLEPEKLLQIIRSMRESHSGPLSIKTRVGFADCNSFEPLLSILATAPLDFITIHARTRCGGYTEPVKIDLLKQAVDSLPYPVIGNGDIWTAADACKMIASTGVAGVMCGRGAVRNPLLFREIAALHCGSALLLNPEEQATIFATFVKQLAFRLHLSERRQGLKIGVFKECSTWLSKNPAIGRNYFQGLKRLTSWNAIFEYLDHYFRDFIALPPSGLTQRPTSSS